MPLAPDVDSGASRRARAGVHPPPAVPLSKELSRQNPGDFSIWTMSDSCLILAQHKRDGVGMGEHGMMNWQLGEGSSPSHRLTPGTGSSTPMLSLGAPPGKGAGTRHPGRSLPALHVRKPMVCNGQPSCGQGRAEGCLSNF